VASADVRREIHFPNLPGYHTLKCDLHMHTVFSDGTVWPNVRVDEAWREGLDAIAITDHIEYQPHKDDLPTNFNRPHELAAAAAKTKNILLIKGAEITRDTPPGHFNAVFLDDINPLDTENFFDVFAEAAKQRAFVFWNHPGWQGPERGRWGPEHTRLYEEKQLHGIEICNGDAHYADAHRWALEKGLALIGTSDIHDPSIDTDWTPAEHRTLTLVFAKERSLASLRDALFDGRTAVWCKNQLFGREEYLAPFFHACVQISPPHHRSRDRLWAEIHNRCELDIELERIGDVGPRRLILPARTTSLARFDIPRDQSAEALLYRATNFLLGPEEALTVRLTLPK
jgi:hypothetical protein